MSRRLWWPVACRDSLSFSPLWMMKHGGPRRNKYCLTRRQRVFEGGRHGGCVVFGSVCALLPPSSILKLPGLRITGVHLIWRCGHPDYRSRTVQARRGSTKRSHEPPDPLFSKAGPTAAASLDNRTIDPTVNLSVDNYDRSASANAEQPYGQAQIF